MHSKSTIFLFFPFLFSFFFLPRAFYLSFYWFPFRLPFAKCVNNLLPTACQLIYLEQLKKKKVLP